MTFDCEILRDLRGRQILQHFNGVDGLAEQGSLPYKSGVEQMCCHLCFTQLILIW